MTYIKLTEHTIQNEHICCAFSDKKCNQGYALKKHWLQNEFAKGYVFSRLDERAKVFIEYGDAEEAWLPVVAPNYIMLGCFWVSGKYKQQGHGKALLQQALNHTKAHGKAGLVTVVGQQKLHFMSDGKWLKRQGFTVVDSLPSGFELIALNVIDNDNHRPPHFADSVKPDTSVDQHGLVAYYSNRCPYTDYYVNTALVETAQKHNLPLTVVHLSNKTEAQQAPTPATIFSLFLDGKLITTNISVCLNRHFDKILAQC